MTEREAYTQSSIELHLFFLRIMKEHALFLSYGFTETNKDFSHSSLRFKHQFEQLLSRVIRLGSRTIRPELLNSCELVTGCTLTAEQQTEKLTGIPINKNITHMEETLVSTSSPKITLELSHHIQQTNQQILLLLNGFIRFQESVLNYVKSCTMFTVLYPSLLQHMLHESLAYRDALLAFDTQKCTDMEQNAHTIDQEFWNHVMMDHALTLRGLLDPSENKEIVQSNCFAEIYADLLDLKEKSEYTSLTATENFRDFKQDVTVGSTECELKSIMLPLFADHLLREAHHYLRLLREHKQLENE